MAVVAMDTSALMMPVEFDVRVFDELERLLGDPELVTPRAVVSELERLAGGGSQEARAARVGLDLVADRCRAVEADVEDPDVADDALVALARAGSVDYVVTNDGPLRDRVLAEGVPVVGVRGRNTLAITSP